MAGDLAAAVGRGHVGRARHCSPPTATYRSPTTPSPRCGACTSLRGAHGDGHVAALTAAGLDGLEAHVLISRDGGTGPEDLQKTRGWTAADWDAAVDRGAARGLVDGGGLTDAGRAVRAEVEAVTDRLAEAPFAAVAAAHRAALLAALDPVAVAVSRSGIIRYPNPIGLPPL